MSLPKVLVVVGPTSSGKSELAVRLAKKFDGEVISADSRQTYKGLDIGSGKITEKEMAGVPHHLLSIADPAKEFTAADFKKLAEEKIEEIVSRDKLPIIAGGTGFYIQTIVDNFTPPEVPPDKALRDSLVDKTPEELFGKLKKLDPDRAETIDLKNPRRLIRAIEIATHLGKVPHLPRPGGASYEILQIGLLVPEDELVKRIKKRTGERLEKGMVEEAEKLRAGGLSWERIREFGLGYRCIADYLQEKLDKKELEECIVREEKNYAKRQMRWFRRDKRIKWFKSSDLDGAEKEAGQFLKS